LIEALFYQCNAQSAGTHQEGGQDAQMTRDGFAQLQPSTESATPVLKGSIAAIQLIKANARGFRNFTNYRTRILFHCGKLNLAWA
jgi:hypothetical protein